MDTMSTAQAASALIDMMDDDGYFPGDGNQEAPIEKPHEFNKGLPEEEVVEESEEESEEALVEEEELEEEEEETEGEPEERLFDIVIGDEEYEVNEEELKSGYLRNEAFVQRQTQLEQEYAARYEELESREIQLDQELEMLQMVQATGLQKFNQVNWEALKVEDPEQYREMRLAYIEEQEGLRQTNQKRSQLQQLHQKAQAIKQEAHLAKQRELVSQLIPEFSQPEVRAGIAKYAESIGFTADEIAEIADARAILVLNQARLYAESQVRRKAAMEKKDKVEVPSTVLKPGTIKQTNTASVKRTKAAKDQFMKSGDARDAAAYILQAGLV